MCLFKWGGTHLAHAFQPACVSNVFFFAEIYNFYKTLQEKKQFLALRERDKKQRNRDLYNQKTAAIVRFLII